ncbi:DUF616 domain containing protein [Nitzschia inconspicua]|uniref:DUF616 domain containing protein n=1 Tax=Nitzschia inconspicua TaxID=303405 RepID=A0A9K3K566_9STRA|nr:DUF616 domain containing protein [Nitzschia inconspicua]KAG7343661.1 DUF616 domain containing protein [Nitzschia inconspicua]
MEKIIGGGILLLTRRAELRWTFFLLAIFSHWLLSVVYQDQLRAATTTMSGTDVEPLMIIQNQSHKRPHAPLWFWEEGNVTTFNTSSNATCGFERKHNHPMTDYVRDSINESLLGKNLTTQCHNLTVYSVAFDDWTLEQFHTAMMIRQPYSKQQLETHGPCFVLFTLQELINDMPTMMNVSTPGTLVGHYWVIPLPAGILPYVTSVQNNQFIKYLGMALFPHSTSTLIWQEASTFFTKKYMYNVPSSYLDLVPGDDDAAACLTGINIPAIERNSTRSSLYQETCQRVTDLDQRQICQSYTQKVDHPHQLDQAMIGTSFMVWKNSHFDCRRFNAELQCTMLHELHSSNTPIDDSLVLPYAISQQRLHRYHKGHSISTSSTLNQQINELEMYAPGEYTDHRGPMVRVIRSNCHWTRGSLGQNCHYWPEVKRHSIPTIPFDALSHQTTDFHTCTSPEANISFPMKGNVSSIFNTHHSCGLMASNPITNYLKETVRDKFMPTLLRDCPDLVVFGVALGSRFVNQLQESLQKDQSGQSNRLLQTHGKCFFLFVSQQDMPQQLDRPLLQGYFWFVPIPESIFPYDNARRNAKLIKYMGHEVFPNVSTVIWQDAKLVSDFKHHQAADYRELIRHNDTCVTTFGLPVHANTLGEFHPAVLRGELRPSDKFQSHCNTIVRAVKRRPNVTDSIDSVAQQCLAYVQQATTEAAMELLHQNMVDTAFIIWNHGSNECRDFSNQFRCSLLDQIHCHSDRDQVPFPFVLQQFGLEGYYKGDGTHGLTLVDNGWDPRKHDLDMKRKIQSNGHTSFNTTSLLRILRSNCHWYTSRIGQGCNYW